MQENEKFEDGKIEVFILNMDIVESIVDSYQVPFEALFDKGVHKGKISNLAVSQTRSILFSVCEDSTCKVWQYYKGFKCLFSVFFHETPTCVSLDPMSQQCAIGFKDGVKFYYILEDDLKCVYNSEHKQCNAVKYSEQGTMVAVASFN